MIHLGSNGSLSSMDSTQCKSDDTCRNVLSDERIAIHNHLTSREFGKLPRSTLKRLRVALCRKQHARAVRFTNCQTQEVACGFGRDEVNASGMSRMRPHSGNLDRMLLALSVPSRPTLCRCSREGRRRPELESPHFVICPSSGIERR